MMTTTTQGAEWPDQQVHPPHHMSSDQDRAHHPSLQERPLHLQLPLRRQEQQQRHHLQAVKTETIPTAPEAVRRKTKEA